MTQKRLTVALPNFVHKFRGQFAQFDKMTSDLQGPL